MQKHIISVLLSFFGVIAVILLGTNIAYRTNVLPAMESDLRKEQEKAYRREQEMDEQIENLQKELGIATNKQYEAEERLKEKLAIEERIAQEKARQEQAARIAAQQKAAEKARLAAEADAKSSSKKSKAS